MGKVVPAGWGGVVVPPLSSGHLTPDSPGIWQGWLWGQPWGVVWQLHWLLQSRIREWWQCEG